ncbi:heme exporter protein CcmB [Salinisphaera sp. SWV1]|uniref:heme exporter protein CcmB n=1 Tax=Salinisphaera sp. SWV1 TaxID=3454139 RepID=UPI003F87ECDD
MSMLSGFWAVLKRDLQLSLRDRADVLNPLLFFVMVVCVFPLGANPRSQLLSAFAPAIIWVAALLATLLSLERLFRSDFEDGSLEQLVLSPHPTPVLVAGKIAAHWLTSGLPLLLLSPLLAVILGLPGRFIPLLFVSLALGTPILSLVGAIGVALTVGLKRGGMLVTLLVLPLYTPVLIFGANMVGAAAMGLPVVGQLFLLAAMLALAITLAPLAAGAALRIAIE